MAEEILTEVLTVIGTGFAIFAAIAIATGMTRFIGWIAPSLRDEDDPMTGPILSAPEYANESNQRNRREQPHRPKTRRVRRRPDAHRGTPDPVPTVQQQKADTRPKRTPPTPHGRWIGKAWMPLNPDE